jgi:hypothetical protein
VELIDTSLPLWQKYSAMTLTDGYSSPSYTTVADAIARAQIYLANTLSQIGKQAAAQRDWRYLMTATYLFQEGRMKGLRTGVNFRYEMPSVIGYARTQPYTSAAGLTSMATIASTSTDVTISWLEAAAGRSAC